MNNSIAPGSSADVNVRVTALTTNPNVPAQYKTIILKKNLVNGVNTLTQEMISAQNTKYVIKYDYTLGEDITIPANCILEFDGGSISASGNNNTITLNKTPINTNGKPCFGDTVKLTGKLYNNDFYFDWFDNYKIDKSEFDTIVISANTKNDNVMQNHMFNRFNYHFGEGIYPFNKPIGQEDRNFSELFWGGNYDGVDKHKTFLYFPNSRGFSLFGGDWSNQTLRDMTIYSKGECFFVNVYAADTAGIPNNRYNAVHESYFENLDLFTINGDFCFGAYVPYSSFIYGNHFRRVFGWAGEDKAIFSGIGIIGTEFYDCCDARFVGGYRDDLIKTLPACKASLWDACIGVSAIACNTSYGLKHIYTWKNSGKNASEIGLDSSLGIMGYQGVTLAFRDCNFESYLGSFIETRDANVNFRSIYFDDTCSFTLGVDLPVTDIQADSFVAFKIFRVNSIRLPKNTTGIYHDSGTSLPENKIVRTGNLSEVKYNNVKINAPGNSIDESSPYFLLPLDYEINNDKHLPRIDYSVYKSIEGAAYENLYSYKNYVCGIEFAGNTIRVCTPMTWSELVALAPTLDDKILIVEANITLTDSNVTNNLKGIEFRGGKIIDGYTQEGSADHPHFGSNTTYIKAEKTQIFDTTIDVYAQWKVDRIYKEWFGDNISDSVFNQKVTRMVPIGAVYFNGIKPLWLKEINNDAPVWVDATGTPV